MLNFTRFSFNVFLLLLIANFGHIFLFFLSSICPVIFRSINSAKYIQLPENLLISDLDEGEVFQHDIVPHYRLRKSQQRLADEGVTVMKDCPNQRLYT